jgi:hypothetical protein
VIVFTSGALVVVIILAILIGPLYFFDFMSGTTENWIIGSAALVVGAIASLAGVRARFFWIFPVWFIGLGILVIQTFYSFGGWGLLAALGGLVGAVTLLVIAGWRIEKSEWKNAPAALAEAKVALLDEDDDTLWAQLTKAFFVPGTMTLTAEMCAHDREVLALIREHMGDRLWPEAIDAVDALDVLLQEAAAGGDKVEIEASTFAAVRRLIESKGAGIDPQVPAVME